MIRFAPARSVRASGLALGFAGTAVLLVAVSGCAVTSPMPVPQLKGSYSSTAVTYGQGSKTLAVVKADGKTGIAFNCVGTGKGTVTFRPAPGPGKMLVTCDPAGHATTGSVSMTLPASTHETFRVHVTVAAGTQWALVVGTAASR